MNASDLMFTLIQEHHIDDAYAKEAGSLGFKSRQDFEIHYLSTLQQRAEKLESELKANDWRAFRANTEAVKKGLSKRFSEHFKLVCGSATDDSILMWSHYADEHSGIVVELDLTKPPFCDLPDTEIMYVDYGDERAELTFPVASNAKLEEMHRLARTKASAWSYEKEIRVVLPPSMCATGRFLPIACETIRGVILGCRAGDDLVSAAHEQKRRPELSHIYIKRAVLHPDKFQLDFQPLDAPTPGP
jgi:hypothetical protein